MKGSRGALVVSAGTRKSFTLLWVFLFVLSLLLQYAAPRTALSAGPVLKAGTVQGFEVDGDLKSGDAASNPGAIPAAQIDGSLTNGDDWLDGASGNGVVDPATPPVSKLIADKANSNTDDQFIGGAKELDTCTWGYDTGPITGKDDIKHVMAYAKFVGNSAFFYMGAERIINNGDTHVDFELNRNPFKVFPGAPGVSKPDRSVGDLIVALEFSNGGSVPVVTVYEVAGVSNCLKSGQVAGETVTVNDITSGTAVHSATNFVDLANAGFGYTIPSFEFAEASIDLAELGIQTACPGLSAGSIRTRAGGDVSSSQLKDTVDPFPIDLNNCGKLRIQKRDAQGNPLGGATFTVSPNPIPGGSGTLTITDNGTNDANSANGVIDIDPAKPDTYTICETDPPTGYKLPSPACQTKTVPNNGGFADATVTFVDPRKTATTTLVLQSSNPTDGSFIDVNSSITLVVRETNTGESTLSNVNITGTNSCPTTGTTAGKWIASATKVGGGAFSGSLSTGQAVDFTCTFIADGNDFNWSATGHGTDELGDAASLANETVNGSYDVLMPATTLTIRTNAPAQVHEGDSVTIVVREANTGEGTITNVHVDGTGPCAANWVASSTKVGGGAFSGSLASSEAVDFTCAFSAPASDFSWTADGKGTDALGHAVPATGEHQQGSVDVVSPSTSLTLKSVSATKIHAGDSVTIVVTETNTGDGPLTNVHVDAGGDCASFSPANVATLAASASQDFTCTINTNSSQTANLAWTADGKGTDALGRAAPATGEHQEGTITVINPATVLSIKTAPPAKAYAGQSITIVVTETNTGDDTLANVHVTGTGSCASWSPANVASLAPSASVDFSCTFSAPSDDFSWSATALSTDSLGAAAPLTDEVLSGEVEVINPATTLVLKSSSPVDLTKVLQGSSVTVTVTETNVGDDTLTGVDVTGTNSCATWSAVGSFSGTLAPSASHDFSCTFSVTTADVDWTATGHGTDSLQNPAPADNETTGGHIHVVNPNIDVVKTAGSSLGSQVADGAVYQSVDGSTVVYKYVVTTQDPDGLTDVQVSDDVCSPVTAVTSGSHNVGDTNTNDVLEPGESWVFQCSSTLTIAGDANTTINGHPGVINIATASGQPAAGGRVSDTDEAKVELLIANIQAEKTVDGEHVTTAKSGDTLHYAITVTNTGSAAGDATVSDDISALLAHGTYNDDASDGGTLNGSTLEWPTFSLAANGGTKTLTFTITLDSEFPAGTTDLPNAVVVVGIGSNCAEQSEDADCVTDTTVEAAPGIHAEKTVDGEHSTSAQPGDTLHYEITVHNSGDAAGDVIVSDDISALLAHGTYNDDASDGGTLNGSTLEWPKFSLGAGATKVLTFTVTLDSNGWPIGVTQLPNTVVVVGEGSNCPAGEGDEDCDTNTTVNQPELTIEKSFTGNTLPDVGGHPQAKVGDTLTYTLAYTLTNGPVHNAVITDVLPAGLADGAPFDISDGGTYNAGTRTITWHLGTLSSSGTVTYKIKVAATAPAVLNQPFVNTATIDSDETQPDSDTAAILVPAPPKTITPPNTATDSNPAPASNPGLNLMLVLLGLAGLVTVVGVLTPAPARARRRQPRR